MIGLGIKIVLNEWFVEKYGTLGSSGATIVSLFVILLVMWFNSPKELKESLLKNNFGWKLVLR